MKRTIPKFVNIEIPGGNYISHTEPPFVIGKISTFKTENELKDHLEELKPYVYKILDNYNICMSLWVVLDDKELDTPKSEIQKVIDEMLEHYELVKVKKSLKFYEKFKTEKY